MRQRSPCALDDKESRHTAFFNQVPGVTGALSVEELIVTSAFAVQPTQAASISIRNTFFIIYRFYGVFMKHFPASAARHHIALLAALGVQSYK